MTLGRPKVNNAVTQFRTPLDDSVSLPFLKNADQADTNFMELGMCKVYPSVDFFSYGKGMQARAKEVCAECSVIEECLWFATCTSQQFGVWGGTTEEERKPLIKMLLAKETT